MKRVFISATKIIGYIVAGLIILTAIGIIAARLLTPQLDKHRTDFEKLASAQLGMPVSIEKVNASWYRYEPVISLKRVTILNKDTKEPAMQIKRVNVFISIPQSIWQLKPVISGLMVSGTEVKIRENENKQFSVQGFPTFGENQPYAKETNLNDVLAWLSTQPKLILRNIDIFYMGFNRQDRHITLMNLAIKNNGTQHSIFGKAVLHQEVPTAVTAAVEWEGEKVDLAQIKAKIYLYVSGLSLPQWLKDYTYKNWTVQNGMASAKIWATWTHGGFHKMQSQFQLYDMTLASVSTKKLYKINRLSGNIGWRHDNDMYVIAGDDLLVDLPQHLWPVTNFYLGLKKTADNEFHPVALNIGYVDLRDMHNFMGSFLNILPEGFHAILDKLKPRGAIQNAVMTFAGGAADWQQLSISANLEKISIQQWKQFPGIQNLSADIKWNGKEGNVVLHSNRVQFLSPEIFTNPIMLEQVLGEVKVSHEQNNSWNLTLNKVQLLNSDLAVNASGNILLPPDLSAEVNLTANLALQKAKHVTRYLPMKVFDVDLQKWLKEAFLGGEATSLNAVIRGKLNDFPFDNNNGEFSISGIVNNVDLHYAPAWPTLKGMNAKLNFNGKKLAIDLFQANISNINITNVHAEIPNLTGKEPAILFLQSSDIPMDFSRALDFVRQSPLNATIGKIFTDAKAQGPITLKFDLTVPLAKAEDTTVNGKIALQDASIKLVPWKLSLDHLRGNINFTENSTDSDDINAVLFNKPFTFKLVTIDKGKPNSHIQTVFKNQIDMTDLENWLKLPFTKVVQGSTDVTAQIDFVTNAPLAIHLQSDLQGVVVNLPDEFGKKADSQRAFAADIFIDEKSLLLIRINYADMFSAGLRLERKQEAFNLLGAVLHLGQGSADLPQGAGLFITGDFDELTWDKIKSYLDKTGGSGGEGFANLPPLKNVTINAKTLALGAQRFSNVNIVATPGTPNWNIAISSPAIAGQIQAPANLTGKGSINAQFSKFNIQSSANIKSTMTVDVKSLPAISITANNVSLDGSSLGQIIFNAVPSGSGLLINTLKISNPYGVLTASGDWSADNVTRLDGEVNSSNVSALLASFGLGVHNFIAEKGKLSFSLSWQDAPYAPSFATMNGNALVDIGKGRIVDVGQASGAKMDFGRMLSLFSLQTLPRRLSLDFSDLFQKGYSFDYFRGNFTLRNGNAETNNTRFDGPVARIDIKGRIGFRAKDYDLTLSVTPYVTSSIPVAAALISGLNPVVGLAAMAVNSAIGSKLITYHYTVTGPWSNPSWESVGSQKTGD